MDLKRNEKRLNYIILKIIKIISQHSQSRLKLKLIRNHNVKVTYCNTIQPKIKINEDACVI